jgi:DNA-binding GntR family transcriptional regulator
VRLIPSNFLAVSRREPDQIENEQLLLGHMTDRDATAARTMAEQHVLAARASLAG